MFGGWEVPVVIGVAARCLGGSKCDGGGSRKGMLEEES